MGNNIRTSTVGIDTPIQGLQTFIYNQLMIPWAYSGDTFNMFGRAYRNYVGDGYAPQLFINGTDKDYFADNFYDDTKFGTAFWGVGEKTVYEAGSTLADVFLIFMINLTKIKGSGSRMDEEARLDVEIICSQIRNGARMVGFRTGIDSVFQEYTSKSLRDKIKYTDAHPFHCFRIDFKLLYNIKN